MDSTEHKKDEALEILKIVRDHINYGQKPHIKKRHLKKLLKPLIEQNNPEAMLLFSTLPSQQSDKKMSEISFKMPIRAAKLSFPPAISNLAEIHYDWGNYDKAYLLYQQAAEFEEAHALYVLSAAYEFGIDGLEKNLALSKIYKERAEKAKKWDFMCGYNDEFIMHQ